MHGPAQHIKDNWDELVEAIGTMDLTPELYMKNCERMTELKDNSVHLIITSPPYPLVQMWDEQLAGQLHMKVEDVPTRYGFQHIHRYFKTLWKEFMRVLVPGGIMVINIGDATRRDEETDTFQCWKNHAQVEIDCQELGFESLVNIYWKKPTNKPNAFLGSGFVPPNGYLSLIHI